MAALDADPRGGPVPAIDAKLRGLGLPAVQTAADELPAPAVAMQWVPQTRGTPDIPANMPRAYWPGGEYVDWVGTDFYSRFPNFHWLDDFYRDFPGKPFVFGEWALWGADDPGFVNRLFAWIHDRPRVRMVVYNQGKLSDAAVPAAPLPALEGGAAQGARPPAIRAVAVGSGRVHPEKLETSEWIAALGGLLLGVCVFMPWYEPTPRPATRCWPAYGRGRSAPGRPTRSCAAAAGGALAPLVLLYIVLRDHELSWPRGEMTAVVAIAAFGAHLLPRRHRPPRRAAGRDRLAMGWYARSRRDRDRDRRRDPRRRHRASAQAARSPVTEPHALDRDRPIATSRSSSCA